MTIQERARLSLAWRNTQAVFDGWMSYRPKADEEHPGVWESCVPSALRPKADGEYPLFAASVVECAIEAVAPRYQKAVRQNLKACMSDDARPLIQPSEPAVEDLRNWVIYEVEREVESWINS